MSEQPEKLGTTIDRYIDFLEVQRKFAATNCLAVNIEIDVQFNGEEKPWHIEIDWDDPIHSIEQTKSDIDTLITNAHNLSLLGRDEDFDEDLISFFYGHAAYTDEHDEWHDLVASLKKGIKSILICSCFENQPG